jgi:uracil-DNA glycosylase
MTSGFEIDEINKEYEVLPKKYSNWGLSSNFVPGDGPTDAKIMIIGQAPGRNEDEQRKPFIGSAGKLLTSLIKRAGLERENVYITSVVQFFPPENRLPTEDEAQYCLPFLKRQIKTIKPKLIVLLGNFSAFNVAGIDQVMKNHGKLIESEEYGCDLFITLHPAAAVRIKTNMPVIEKDFENLGEIIKKKNIL